MKMGQNSKTKHKMHLLLQLSGLVYKQKIEGVGHLF